MLEAVIWEGKFGDSSENVRWGSRLISLIWCSPRVSRVENYKHFSSVHLEETCWWRNILNTSQIIFIGLWCSLMPGAKVTFISTYWKLLITLELLFRFHLWDPILAFSPLLFVHLTKNMGVPLVCMCTVVRFGGDAVKVVGGRTSYIVGNFRIEWIPTLFSSREEFTNNLEHRPIFSASWQRGQEANNS